MISKGQNIIRWILVVVLTPLVSLACFALLLRLTGALVGIPDSKAQMYLMMVFIATVTAVVWIVTSYVVAPDFKVKTTWFSFSVGAIVSLLITFPSLSHLVNISLSNPWVGACLSSIGCGLLLTFKLTHKAD